MSGNQPDVQDTVVDIPIVSVKEVRNNHEHGGVGDRRNVEHGLSFVVTRCLAHGME